MHQISDAILTLKGIARYRSFLRRSDRMSPEEVRRHQAGWLGALLRHAHANVPWYSAGFRRHGVDPAGSDPFFELSKMPILTKAEVRECHGDFCVAGTAKTSLSFATSGTTGEPLKAYTSPEQWIWEQGIIWRQWKWAGYRLRDRVAIFRSHAPKPGEPILKHDRLRNWTYFSVFRMDERALDGYFEYLRRWKPRFLRGYPSSLLLVAQHALRKGIRLPGLRAAFSASEAVPDTLRPMLHEAFGIELFDHYGQAEITCMFHDCERHEGMHVDWEYGLVELVPSGQPGLNRLIATNLHNTAMPLLRYDTGDLVAGDWRRCSCGRVAPIVPAILGRMDDFLIATDGSRMSTVNLYTFFSKLPEIRRFQIVQEAPGRISVMISLWQDGDASASFRRRVEEDLSRVSGLAVQVPMQPAFVQSREGKCPTFVQRIR